MVVFFNEKSSLGYPGVNSIHTRFKKEAKDLFQHIGFSYLSLLKSERSL